MCGAADGCGEVVLSMASREVRGGGRGRADGIPGVAVSTDRRVLLLPAMMVMVVVVVVVMEL